MTNHSFTAHPGAADITSTYTFTAPREKVLAAYTNPELIPQWWGPESMETKVEEMNPVTGGGWRFSMSAKEGAFEFRGVYHEVQAPERLVMTWQFMGAPTVMLQVITFEQSGDKTTVTDHTIFASVDERDAMLESGMDGGSVSMMERLAKLV